MFIHIALDTVLGVAHKPENELRITAKQVHVIDLLVSHTFRSSHQLLKYQLATSSYTINSYIMSHYGSCCPEIIPLPSLRLSQSSAEVNNLIFKLYSSKLHLCSAHLIDFLIISRDTYPNNVGKI